MKRDMDLNESYNGVRLISGEFCNHEKIMTLYISPVLEIKITINDPTIDQLQGIDSTEELIKRILNLANQEISNKL